MGARGTLWVAETGEHLAELEDLERAFRMHGVRAERLWAEEVAHVEPRLTSPIRAALLAREDLVLDPAAAAAHLWARAQTHGALLHIGRGAQSVGNGRVRLEDGEEMRAESVVAAGSVTPALIPGLPIRPRKGHLVALEAPADFVRHQIVEVGYLASVNPGDSASISFNVQPSPHGGIIVGASRQYGSDSVGVEPGIVRTMMGRAERFLPSLPTLRRRRTWAGLRPASADHLPFIGTVPEDPRTIVAAGHEGLGITESLGTGRLVADILRGRPSEIPRAPYALEGRNRLGGSDGAR